MPGKRIVKGIRRTAIRLKVTSAQRAKPRLPSSYSGGVDKKSVNVIREWITLFIAAGSLFVAIITFWITAQISGLEDYFHSEISRRNSELEISNEEYAKIEDEIIQRRGQVDNLRDAADSLTAASVVQIGRIQDAQFEMDRRRDEAIRAARALDETRRAAALISAEREEQAKFIDATYRRQTAERFVLPIYLLGAENFEGWPSGATPEKPIKFGKLFEQLLENSPLNNVKGWSPYAKLVATRVPQVCPGIFETVITIPPYPAAVVDTPSRISSARTREEAYKIAEQESRAYAEKISARYDIMKGISDKLLADRLKFYDRATECVCLSLADDQNSPESVCETSRSSKK